jgi:predicted nucleic acid-binding protein
MYVETDLLFALATPDDWLQPEAGGALEREDIHTSLPSYAEFLVRAYEPGEGFAFDVSGTTANLLEFVPVRPDADEAALLAAAVYLDEHDVTPFDAIHAGIASTRGGEILASDAVFDELDVERHPLESDSERE